MITDLFNFDKVRKGDDFALKEFKDSYYTGQVCLDNNFRQGFGICQYYNGRHYEGSWVDDKRHGKGYERFSNGNVYSGDFYQGKCTGKGVYTWSNGDTYDGEWKDG